ncbi:MAG: PAS domain-containing sensor histidine kinase [Alphaproteobacteria bacterium]|nr:MAG: PAS domain-containing sensor histidine kinase [Alphaproteobacteria bacterium]TAF14912.1 MAG: PAS domain-containing sensor histidine kinase [Alphaproteobacteria bacterium]TAF39376.1 MAG: PAS domain-containing sensor histidine kinase [Alphaproteobacteria bacterium]TAF77190.1 MAG: PAS domain-containing sensor histidine kinase [Alphaproteobacteria bacterium]
MSWSLVGLPELFSGLSFSTLVPIFIGGGIVSAVALALIRRILGMRAALKRGYAGAQLHTQVVKTFSLVTIIPTVVISIFSIAFFYYGIKDWFNERITIVLQESVAVAEAYLAEHERTLRADAGAMANDIARELPLAHANPAMFSEILNSQVALRSLSEAVVLAEHRELARSLLSFSLSFETLPDNVIDAARAGEVVIFKRDDRIFAVVALDAFQETYLVVSRMVDGKILNHIAESEGAARTFEEQKNTINQLQMIFVVVFILVTLMLLLGVIWYGISFASRLAIPLITLAQATERVRAGDYSIQIEDDTDHEEMQMLIRHFNRMTEQLYQQRMELTQATRMLDQRRRFMETVLGGVSAGIIALDTNFVVSLSNISAMHLLGFHHERNMIGQSLRTLVPELSAVLEHAQKYQSTIHQEQVEIRRGNKIMIFQVKISAEMSQSYIEGFIVTLDDITPLIAAQRSAAWSDVARRVAHEIKNPLTPIKLSVDRLRKKFIPEDAVEREAFLRYLETISRHLRDIGRIVEEFSSFARMPAPRFAVVDIKPLLESACFSCETSFPEVRCFFESLESEIFLLCDEAQLSQVMTNLLKNAAESIERREDQSEQGWIHMQCVATPQTWVLTVNDNGVGFPEELIPRIMEPYVTTRSKGTGLGLAIVKKIIEDHKGSITVENREGGGAIVCIIFPRNLAILEKDG